MTIFSWFSQVKLYCFDSEFKTNEINFMSVVWKYYPPVLNVVSNFQLHYFAESLWKTFKCAISGNRGDYELKAGPKVLLVASGGTLELHGRKKLSWTKLSKTIEKLENTDNIVYDHLVSSIPNLTYQNL